MDRDKIDPIIVEYVDQVANRFGVMGLEDLIATAVERLGEARAALRELP
jgi:hypothetical protein